MQEVVAPEQEAPHQRPGSTHQPDRPLTVTVEPSVPSPPPPTPPPPPPPPSPPPPPQQPQPQQQQQQPPPHHHQQQQHQQQQQPSVEQQQDSAWALQGPKQHLLPSLQDQPLPQQQQAGVELAAEPGPVAPPEPPEEVFSGIARPLALHSDSLHQQQQQQQQQLEHHQHAHQLDELAAVAAVAGASDGAEPPPPPQAPQPHILHPPDQPAGLLHKPPQQSPSPPPQPQLRPPPPPQFGSPPHLPLSLPPPAPLQLAGGAPGPSPLGLSLFGGPVPPSRSGAGADIPLAESLGVAPQHPHPHSQPHPFPHGLGPPGAFVGSPPQPHLHPQQQHAPPSPQQPSQQLAQQQQQQQQQQKQPPQQQLQPQLQQQQLQQQQHVVWDELRQRDAQILVLQKKLGHFRSWLAGVHAKAQASNPSAINNYKRLYVGNLPPNTTEEELKQFLHSLMVRTGANAAPGNAILSCKLKAAPAAGAPPGAAGPVPPPGPGPPDKHYAFIELRSVEEASNAMAFDGVAFKNVYLKVRRPSNYDPATAVMLGPTTPDPTIDLSQLEICRTVVENSPHKLFVGGLPCEWGEDMVKELLVPYGTLKSFNLVMDKSTGKSKGYAFCEFVEDSSADLLIKNLHLRRIGSKALTVKRAMEGSRTGVGMGVSIGVGMGIGSPGGGPTGSGQAGSTGISMAAAAAAQQQQQQLLSGSPQAIPPMTPAGMGVMSRVGASPAGPGGGSPGGGAGGAAAAAAAAAIMAASGVGPDSPTPQGLRGPWGAQDVTDALNALLQQHSASRNLFAAAAAAAANPPPPPPQTSGGVPGLAAAFQQFQHRGGAADLASVGGGGAAATSADLGPRGGPLHHPPHPGGHHQHPHPSQHPSQHHQHRQEVAAAAAAEAAAQQLAAAGVGAFDLSSLTGQGIGFW